ncbi:unnamed protein product [Lymnaea stagnalis]|uniref:Uncharacterized protein n=1 Tax=Lymnaea stagnalis TaxID=6523 RepID=A0AAV2H4F0_LYMST
MFVTVRYGDDQEQLFNPNSRNNLFLLNVKNRCQCQSEDVIDVSDERGNLKNLSNFPKEYAKEYLKDRERLVLVRRDYDKSSYSTQNNLSRQGIFKPLLQSLAGNQEFIDKLNSQIDESSLSELSTKSQRPSTFDVDEFRAVRSRSRSSMTSSKKPLPKRGSRTSGLRKSATNS